MINSRSVFPFIINSIREKDPGDLSQGNVLYRYYLYSDICISFTYKYSTKYLVLILLYIIMYSENRAVFSHVNPLLLDHI